MKVILKDLLSNSNSLWSRNTAFEIRKKFEENFLNSNDMLELDFLWIESTTQSSIDELIWVFITNEWVEIFKRITFSNCNNKIKAVIKFVFLDRYSKLNQIKKIN